MKAIKVETTKLFKHYGEKVKQISFHPTKPLVLLAQYNGEVSVFNYNTQSLTKKFEVSNQPIRTAIWAGEDWIITAGDDLQVRVFNFHTTQKLQQFESHKDYLRKVVYNHHGQFLMTCSDDKTIVRWSKVAGKFARNGSWEEHKHFVMDVKFHPKDEGVFASASLDGTLKLWHVASTTSNSTLRGHKSGINCLEFSKGDRALLISGGDDYSVIVWDLVSRTILTKIDRHEGNVVDVRFLDTMPFFVSVAEDGKINFYNTRNLEFCFDVVNFMNKGWSLSTKDNLIAAGYDEGAMVLQLGNNVPLASSGKGRLVWSKNSEVFTANLKAIVTKKINNFEKIDAENKELGNLEIFPNKISHNDNAQFFAAIDDSEYIIYKSQNFKQVLFGQSKEFVWGPLNKFAIVNQNNELIIYNTTGNILNTLKFDFYVEAVYGGTYIGVYSGDFVIFYDWNGEGCLGRIDAEAKDVIWDNEQVIVKGVKSFFHLKVHPELEEDNVFELVAEIPDKFISGLWIMGLFVYITESFKLNILVRQKSFTITNINFFAVILEYLDNHQRIFLFDNNCTVTSFAISKELLKIVGVLQEETDADSDSDNKSHIIEKSNTLGEEERDFVAKILQSFDHIDTAFRVVANPRQKLEFAIKLGYLEECITLCNQLEEAIYWKKLGDLAAARGRFAIAEKAFWSCEDLNSLLLLGSCLADQALLERVGEAARGRKHYSVAFTAFWVVGQSARCLETLTESERFGEAAIFAKTYLPSRIQEIFESWKGFLKRKGQNLLHKRLANPLEIPSEYSELAFLAEIEAVVEEIGGRPPLPASHYPDFLEQTRDLDFYGLAKSAGIGALREKLGGIYEGLALAGQQRGRPTAADAVDVSRETAGFAQPVEEVEAYEAEEEGWGEVDVPDEAD